MFPFLQHASCAQHTIVWGFIFSSQRERAEEKERQKNAFSIDYLPNCWALCSEHHFLLLVRLFVRFSRCYVHSSSPHSLSAHCLSHAQHFYAHHNTKTVIILWALYPEYGKALSPWPISKRFQASSNCAFYFFLSFFLFKLNFQRDLFAET